MPEKLWAGRFSEGTDARVERFTSSIHYDRKLYAYDIEGSIAHCRMLAKIGVMTDNDRDALIQGLTQVKDEIASGHFAFTDALEDIHMHIESRLAEVVGDAAKKLHTARSRNDQVALDIRMYLRAETRAVIAGLTRLRQVLTDISETRLGVMLPGYTHLQRAQPVLLSHHLMAYYEMFTRDAARFADALKRINVMPLGSAALAGTTYPIDRHYVAGLLDFPAVSANSMDAVADRDFAVEFLAAASLCMVHFSRLSEELILWSSAEFAFIEISDAFTTGSSIMPQKKNPDVCELVRGKTGRVFGSLVTLLTLLKSLPMAYNRDMQEDKEPLFNGVETLRATIDIYTRMLPNITFRADGMSAATTTGFLNATDLADYLVMRGMAFREAHGVAGRAVSLALSQGREIHDLSLDELTSLSDLIADDLFDFLTPTQMIDRRNSHGGTGTALVKRAIADARAQLAAEQEDLSAGVPPQD